MVSSLTESTFRYFVIFRVSWFRKMKKNWTHIMYKIIESIRNFHLNWYNGNFFVSLMKISLLQSILHVKWKDSRRNFLINIRKNREGILIVEFLSFVFFLFYIFFFHSTSPKQFRWQQTWMFCDKRIFDKAIQITYIR